MSETEKDFEKLELLVNSFLKVLSLHVSGSCNNEKALDDIIPI